MPGDLLVDTNVLVFAYDRTDAGKQARALATLTGLVDRRRGKLSAQILGEFFRVVTVKLRPPLPMSHALGETLTLARTWPVLPVTAIVVLYAARTTAIYGLSYYDAQICAAARVNRIETVLSEDFQDGRIIDGVAFRNPFAPAFDLAQLD